MSSFFSLTEIQLIITPNMQKKKIKDYVFFFPRLLPRRQMLNHKAGDSRVVFIFIYWNLERYDGWKGEGRYIRRYPLPKNQNTKVIIVEAYNDFKCRNVTAVKTKRKLTHTLVLFLKRAQTIRFHFCACSGRDVLRPSRQRLQRLKATELECTRSGISGGGSCGILLALCICF